MNIGLAAVVWLPVYTVLPVLVTAAIFGFLLWPVRSSLSLPKERYLPWLVLFAISLAVRLLVVPSLSVHVYDGHEAEYWDLFLGVRTPTRGGTLLYPSMQWMWFILGKILPHYQWVPVVLMSLVGSLGVFFAGGFISRLASIKAGYLAALLVALHPVHAAWSSSAYNVVVPHTLGWFALWCAGIVASSKRPRPDFIVLAVLALVLVVATRIDAVVWAFPVGFLLLRPPYSRSHKLPVLWAGLFGAFLASWVLAPLLGHGPLPGSGERALSFWINLPITEYFGPFGTGLGLSVLAILAIAAFLGRPVMSAGFAISLLGAHLLFSTFDDYGDRHALSGLAPIIWFCCAGAHELFRRFSKVGYVFAVALIGLMVVGLLQIRQEFYASEEYFSAMVDNSSLSKLPIWSAEHAADDCGWINEDARVSQMPQKSHFNLLSPVESHSLRGVDGCLRWCRDVQDYRWSSRGVRDRAVRIEHLFEMTSVAIVRHEQSGYSCVVMDLGARVH